MASDAATPRDPTETQVHYRAPLLKCRHSKHAHYQRASQETQESQNKRRSALKNRGERSGLREKQTRKAASAPTIMPTHNKKCSHGIWQHWCKHCGGSGICQHNRNRYACKECKNEGKTTQLCEHNVSKYNCAQCGTNKCQHGNNKNTCRQCGKKRTRTLCPHGKRKDKISARGEIACTMCREEHTQPTDSGEKQ
jgi:hypothetical protein